MSIQTRTVRGGISVSKNLKAASAAAIGIGAATFALNALSNLNAKRNASRGIGLGLQFPLDLVSPTSNRNYYMTFRFEQYRRRSIFDKTSFMSTGDSIILPIPNNLVDTQAVSWGEEGADPVIGAGIEGMLKGGNNVSLANMESAMETAAADGLITAGAVQAARAAASAVGNKTGINVPIDQFLQMAGFAANPFLTLLFKSPAFKTHTFSWKLAPNNYEESIQLQKIISMFRKHMLPSTANSTGGTLLSYPDIVQVNLFPNEEFLYKFKPCIVESMSVNFAPTSSPSFFKDSNAPTEVQFSINLKEIEYWLQEDVDNFYGV
jgi:hypothetical protein